MILASIPGLISLILAFAIVEALGSLLPCRSGLPCFPRWWETNVPFDYSGTSLLAFALGATLWYPLNWFCKRENAIDRVIEEDRVAFELLLKKAQDQDKTVSVTMSNGKIYVGFVIHLFNPAFPTRSIQILPTKSGYRDEITKEARFTTFYLQALDQIDQDFEAKFSQQQNVKKRLEALQSDKDKQIEEEAKELQAEIDRLEAELYELAIEADDFGIVLPVSEIMSINIFSEYVHNQYFGPTPPQEESAGTPKPSV